MEIFVEINEPDGAAERRWLDTEVRGAIARAIYVTSEELAELLVERFDAADLSRIGRAWAAEGNRRNIDVRSGKMSAISVDAALRRVRDSLRR